MVIITDAPSLQGKITRAYLALVVFMAVLGMVAFFDLIFLERQVTEGEVVSDLKDAVLEMRREEKNFFLYTDNEALQRAIQEAGRSLGILQLHQANLAPLMPSIGADETIERLQTYRERLLLWEEMHPLTRNPYQEEIRTLGHQIYLAVESLSAQERRTLEANVRKSQWILLLSLFLIGLGIILVGRLLKQAVVNPLKQMESRLMPIARGRFDQLHPPSQDREFVTFTDGFNHMLRELEIRQKRMLQSEKLASLGILAAGVAHELNNPLSNISTACQLLQEEWDEASPVQLKQWLGQIDSETDRGRRIVRTLLDFGSQKVFERHSLDLRELVEETRLIIGKALGQASARLDLDIPEQLPLYADKQRLQQLFINLIQNALHAGGSGVLLRISARLCESAPPKLPEDAEVAGKLQCLSKEDGSYVQIVIEDNGPGIPSQHLSRIFDPFFTISEPGHGVGLGLFIVQEIVREHEGCLAIASRPGKGTQVILLLPAEGESDD